MNAVIWWHHIDSAIPHITLAFWLLWALYIFLLSAWILLQKREPIATLSWLLSLALLPIIGFVIYHFLGPTRIRRQHLKRHRAKSGLMPLIRSNSSSHASALMRLNARSTGFAPSSCHALQLLVNGVETFDAIAQAIAQARHHIHLEYYIFEPDQTGMRIRDALCIQALRGVKIRLLLDALGSKRVSKKFLRPLQDAGVDILFFHPFHFRKIWRPNINIRSHRKIIVIDGACGFTGGINITDAENEHLSEQAYHDLHCRIEGEAVRWLQLAFVEDWLYAGGQFQANSEYWPKPEAGAIACQVLTAGPDTAWEPIHRAQVSAINAAKQRVILVTPYFVPSNAALMALSSAALRGLEVKLIVPKRSDSRTVTLAARSYFDELIQAGIGIFEYPHMLHTKALLVDDNTVIIGSSNFDNRSFKLNFELSLLIEDAAVGDALANTLLHYIEQSVLVNKKMKPSFFERLAQAFARLFSPLL